MISGNGWNWWRGGDSVWDDRMCVDGWYESMRFSGISGDG